MIKLRIIATSSMCLLFLTTSIYGIFFSNIDTANHGGTLAASFGLVMWFKWAEYLLDSEKERRESNENRTRNN